MGPRSVQTLTEEDRVWLRSMWKMFDLLWHLGLQNRKRPLGPGWNGDNPTPTIRVPARMWGRGGSRSSWSAQPFGRQLGRFFDHPAAQKLPSRVLILEK